MGGQGDVTCEIIYPPIWWPCLEQFHTGKTFSFTVLPPNTWKSTRKNSGADQKKTGVAAVCAISHRMWRTFLCMEIPLTRGNLGGKNPGAAPQKTGADKEKLHTKSKAHCTSASLSRGGCQMPGESEHCTPSW